MTASTDEDVAVLGRHAIECSAKKDWDGAIDAFSQIIAIIPNDAEAYKFLGDIYGEKGELERAIKNYDQAIAINPNFAESYNNRGRAYHQKREGERAIENYNTAVEYKPCFAEAYNNRGIFYSEKGEVERAIEDFNKAIECESGYAEAYNNRGLAYFVKGDFSCVLSDFSDAYKKGSKDHIFLYLAHKIKNIRSESDNAATFRCFIAVSLAINNIRKELHKKTKLHSVVHYCSLTTLKNMSDGKPFRLYNVAYMNDPEEGEALFRMMPKGANIRAYFYGRDAATYRYQPYYIGSFIAGEKNEDQIIFWRTYGKDNGVDAAGCSLVFDQKQFSDTINKEIEGMASLGGSDKNLQPCLYEVIYEGNKTEKGQEIKEILNDLYEKLDELVKEIKKETNDKSKNELKLLGCKLIDSIRYLFKSKHYEHEQEMRVVEYIGTDKDIKEDDGISAPKFYVEPYENTDFCFSGVVLGPKTENAVALGVWVSKNKPDVTVRQSKVPYR